MPNAICGKRRHHPKVNAELLNRKILLKEVKRMKKTILAILISLGVVFAFHAGAFAQSEDSAAKRELSGYSDVTAWMASYYTDPDPGNIIPAVKITLSEDQIIKDDRKNRCVAHFFAAALQGQGKSMLADINKLVDEPWGAKRQFIQRITDEANNFVSPAANNPDNIDCLWAEFAATGADGPLKKIMQVLNFGKVDISLPFWVERGIRTDSVALEILRDAAQESLVEHAAADKKICDIINKEIAVSKSALYKAKLQDILNDAAQRKGR